MLNEKIKNSLKIQSDSGLYRDPPVITGRDGKYIYVKNKKILNFASNDYLGISCSEEFRKIVAGNFMKYGTSASSSRLVAGNYTAITEAEKAYAEYFGYDDAVFFPSGYQANIGILSALLSRDDIIIFDKHVHASCVKGIKLSGAEFTGYNHNSIAHLEKKLSQNEDRQPVLVTESLFSMDGDFLDVESVRALRQKYNFFSIIDEAHAFGAAGLNGRGMAYGAADLAVGTFGKAFGFFGSFVLLPGGFKEYLFNFSSPLIYTTALPEAHAASALDLLRIIENSDDRREKLNKVSRLMKEELENAGLEVRGDAHILALQIGDEKNTVNISKLLLGDGILVMPARYPTVPIGKAIIRISMTALHDEEDIYKSVELIKKHLHYLS